MKPTLKNKLSILFVSGLVASGLFLTVSTMGGSSASKLLSMSSAQEGVYVIESPNITYNYDKTKFELASLSAKPYVVVRGDKQLINLLKFSGHPKFNVDLTNKTAGAYRSQVSYTGIDKKLSVDVYPNLLDLRLMEQETVKFQPIVEIINDDVLSSKYVISAPELLKEEVLVRDTQKKLASIGQIKGVVDVSRVTKTSDILVDLKVFDRNGHEIKVNLLNKAIKVRVPVTKRVIVVNKEVVEKILIEKKETKTKPVVKQKPEPKQKTPSVTVKPTVEKKQDNPPKKQGVLSFINLSPDLKLIHTTKDLKWSSDFKIDLRGFVSGVYEMTVDDNGSKKVIHFELLDKEKPKDEVEKDPLPSDNEKVEDIKDGATLTKPDTETGEDD